MDKEDMRINSDLYLALMEKDDQKVIEICSTIPKGPLHTVTIHEDTVLHIAVYHKKANLALHLLNMVPLADSHKLTWQNNSGSTMLHETGTNNATVEVAKVMLSRAPMLLGMINKLGETALFYAVRHGKSKIFKYLHGEVQKTHQGPDLKTFLVRFDKSTILHLAILSQNYWISLEIAKKHKHLVYEKDEDEMTPLQILSCSNFKRPSTLNFYMRKIFPGIDTNMEDLNMTWSPLKRCKKQLFKFECAMKLIKLLVEKDTSWENTESRVGKRKEKSHSYAKSSKKAQLEEITLKETAIRLPDTPLFLAARYGFIEIVKEILEVYPQAIEHIDQDGSNILHVAILYHQDEVIDYVVDEKNGKQRLKGKIDNNGNTLLHMVGAQDNDDDELQGPAFVLQKKMRLYKKVQDICPTLDEQKLNYEKKTPRMLLYENNNNLRLEGKQWMTESAKNYTLVAVLIATVAFAAAYTIPGGSDSKTGEPKLKHKQLFFIFTVTDAVSLSAALTSVIIFLNTITSRYKFEDFERSLIRKWYSGLIMLMLSLVTLMVAFAVTLILTINSGKRRTNITLYVVCFFPVMVFILMFLKFYIHWDFFRMNYRQMKKFVLLRFNKRQPTVWYSRQPRMAALPPI